MYSLKFITEKNKEYCFADMSLESGEYKQEGVVVRITKHGKCSKISVQIKNDRVKRVYHIYSTALRNYNKVIIPDSGRDYLASTHNVYFWRRNYASRVYDVKTPLYSVF